MAKVAPLPVIKYKEEDEKLKEKIEAKNSFENYLFQLKNTLNDEKTKDKFEEADRETLTGKIDEATTWFDEHQDEDKEAYSWCINHGIKIGAIAAQKGFDVGSWKIRIVANNKEMISPGDYSRTEIYPKIFELYRYYYKLNTKGNG